MKKLFVFLFIVTSFQNASALSCVNLQASLSRYQESPSVLLLQQFLYEKGFLKSSPNGYFGAGTFAAVKAYQTKVAISPTGTVGPATRASIQKDSCGKLPTVNLPKSIVSSSTKIIEIPKVTQTPQAVRNSARKEATEIILKALYRYFVESRGVYVSPITEIPLELCVVTSSSSDCSSSSVVDVSYLVPSYLPSVPRDPRYASTSILTGYTITRSDNNDIVITSKNAEDGAIIKMRCNFNGFCKDLEYISSKIYKRPKISSLNRVILLKDATPKTDFIIKGQDFTASNTIKLFSRYSSKEYTLGTFQGTNPTATTSTLSFAGGYFNQALPCGKGCLEKLPLGVYDMTLVNEGGSTDLSYITLKGFTSSSISVQINSSILPTTKNVKVATISLSSSVPLLLKGLTLTSTSTSKVLSSKISNFILTDTATKVSYSGGGAGTFSIPSVALQENYTKVYDVYVDTAEVMNLDAGFITYGGVFLATDTFSSVDLELPIKEFSFTVSH